MYMEKIFITPEVIDYVNSNKGAFNGLMPNMDSEWKVKKVTTYPSVNYGNPVVEVEKGKCWMRLPANMFYSKQYAEYLSYKYNKEK